MRDPSLNMEPNTTGQQQLSATTNGAEPRKQQNKSVRVAFGPDLETYIPPRDESPAPVQGHHRSFTMHALPPPQSRPTSSSAGENPIVVPDSPPTVAPDRASDSGRPATLKRAKSDYGPRLGIDKAATGDEEEDFAMRHGWQEEYTSSEYLKILHSVSTSKNPLQ